MHYGANIDTVSSNNPMVKQYSALLVEALGAESVPTQHLLCRLKHERPGHQQASRADSGDFAWAWRLHQAG